MPTSRISRRTVSNSPSACLKMQAWRQRRASISIRCTDENSCVCAMPARATTCAKRLSGSAIGFDRISSRDTRVILLESALVLFSGGQDSTVCLAWALDQFEHVETVGFDYGQRHAVELEVRPHIRTALAARSEQWRS